MVKPGDSFWRIAEKMLGDGRRWQELRDANADLLKNRPPNLIHPGDIVHIPVEPAVGLIPSLGPWPAADNTPPPPFIAMEVDLLHEALFDQVGQRIFETVTGPLVRLPAAPEPIRTRPSRPRSRPPCWPAWWRWSKASCPRSCFSPSTSRSSTRSSAPVRRSADGGRKLTVLPANPGGPAQA